VLAATSCTVEHPIQPTPFNLETDQPVPRPSATFPPSTASNPTEEGPPRQEEIDLLRLGLPAQSPDGGWIASVVETTGRGVEDSAQLTVSSLTGGISWVADAVTERDGWGGFEWPVPLRWSTVRPVLYFTHHARSDGCFPGWINASDLWSLNLQTGKSDFLAPKLGYWIDFAPDEHSILYISHSRDGVQIRNLATGQDTTIPLQIDARYGDRITFVPKAMWSPSGDKIILTYEIDACDSASTAVVLIDLPTSDQQTLIGPLEGSVSLLGWISDAEVMLAVDPASRLILNTTTGGTRQGPTQ